MSWEGLELEHVCDAKGAPVVRFTRRGKRLLEVDAEHVVRLQPVELDGQAPRELWLATSAGAHGNRQDLFYTLAEGKPRQVLEVSTDEGNLEVKDLDGDGRPEISGFVSEYFDALAWDFERPLVLALQGKRWRDVTSQYPERFREAIAEWKLAVSRSTDCDAAQALNIYGLSLLSGAERAGASYVAQECPYVEAWFTENRRKIRHHVRHTHFSQPR
ncbi:MAG: hypothetical protein H6718_12410 [Polyangiaceae bacterium]|nr:hypothetical protein [Myxococcales bacterium]MCB9586196.1 hypothetical protein [Polyangiaceae bacterium]MCB9606873.1 hypothetical protein [Polyangiaceae bacterium]